MKRFIQGSDRTQGILLAEHLDDYVTEDNPVRVVDVFVDELDLAHLGVVQALFNHIGEGIKFRHGGGGCTAQVVRCPLAAG